VVEQVPELVTVARLQFSCAMLMQVSPDGQLALVVQTVAPVRLQVPVVGQLALLVQIVVLVRSHTPPAAFDTTALVQSPSQALPSESVSAFAWVAFGVRTQLSLRSAIPSPSRSPSPSQATPRPGTDPTVCSGL
jgi:hypothetical protein